MLCGLILLAPAPAWPAPARAVPLEIRIGFDGALKIGVPVPAEIRIPPLPSSGPAELIVDAPALGPQAGAVTTSTVTSFESIPGVARVFHFPLVVSDIRRPLTVRVVLGGREIVRDTIAIDPARVGGRVVVAVASERGGLAILHRLPGRVVTAEIPETALPSLWQEYAGVDLLAVRDLDPARLDGSQRQALLTWIRMGGRLLVVARPQVPVPAFLTSLLPPPDSRVRLIAGAPEGWGWVTVWPFDPWEPPFRGSNDTLHLWADALGSPSLPLVNTAALAGLLPDRSPFAPVVRGEVGAAILGYILLLYVLRRRTPQAAGAAAGLALLCIAIGAFTALAGDVRSRSAVLAQATFLEQAAETSLARVRTVAVVAVPYGGPYRLQAPRDATVVSLGSPGDLRLDLTAGGAVLTGRLRPGESGRAFEALGVVPLSTSGVLSSDEQILRVDLGSVGLRRAEVRWRDRAYPLGNLSSGVSVRRLRPDAWVRPDDAAETGERAWIFRGPGADVIMKPATPVLVGEMERSAPVFAFGGTGAPDRRPMILLVPVARR